MRTLLIGFLIVLGTHAVVRRASRMPPETLRRTGRTLTDIASFLSPRIARVLQHAWTMSAAFESAFQHQAPAQPSRGGMSQAEACNILGVSEQADATEINQAYRQLMRRHHPDHGGTGGSGQPHQRGTGFPAE